MRRPALSMVAILVLAFSIVGCGRTGGEPLQPSLNTPVELDADDPVIQTINPVDDDLAAIDLPFALYDRPADPAGRVEVTVRSSLDGTVQGRTSISGDELTDGGWSTARFDPPIAVDDVVAVELRWTGDEPIAVWANRTLDGTVDIRNDAYAEGELVGLDGDLAFRVRTPSGAAEAVGQAGAVTRSAGSRLIDDPLFTVLWLVGLLAAAAGAAWGLRPSSRP